MNPYQTAVPGSSETPPGTCVASFAKGGFRMRSRIVSAGKILSTGLLAALLPGTCAPMESLLGRTQQGVSLDVLAPFGGAFSPKLGLMMSGEDPPEGPGGGGDPI